MRSPATPTATPTALPTATSTAASLAAPTFATRLLGGAGRAIAALDALQPAALFAARWYVASVFFRAGLTKLRDWEITVALFTDEYRVPLLSPPLAAFLGTAAELALPVLLVLGLGGRVAAAGLFIVNVVAVISVADMPPAALQQHLFWGSLLAALLLWGPGRWSVDRLIATRLAR